MKKKIWIALLCLCALLGLELYRSNRTLQLEYEQVQVEKLTQPLRIVHLADLHNSEFGENNQDLIDMVASQQPDLILFTGDLVTGWEKDTAVAMDLTEELVKIAPVYVSIGNHEQQHENQFGSDLTGMLRYRGAKVMEFSYEDITLKEQNLRIGGISGYCVPEIYLSTGEAKIAECEFLRDFQDTERCTMLMAHMPACWILNDGISYWDADLVFSGHTHGGQFRIPLLGGVYGPDMGWFPGWLEGQYPSSDGSKTMILSRGLGSSVQLPRLNNPPQVLVVDLVPAK